MNVTPEEIVRFYLGSLFWIKTERKECYMTIDLITCSGFTCGNDLSGEWNEIDLFDKNTSFKPILNHSCDMPKREKHEYYLLTNRIKHEEKLVWIADTPLSLTYLFRHHYDAFDLIEDGLAIDMVEYQKLTSTP